MELVVKWQTRPRRCRIGKRQVKRPPAPETWLPTIMERGALHLSLPRHSWNAWRLTQTGHPEQGGISPCLFRPSTVRSDEWPAWFSFWLLVFCVLAGACQRQGVGVFLLHNSSSFRRVCSPLGGSGRRINFQARRINFPRK